MAKERVGCTSRRKACGHSDPLGGGGKVTAAWDLQKSTFGIVWDNGCPDL
jgi:hypothetical protein